MKYFPPEEPNLTDPVEVLEKLKEQDESQVSVNLNNVQVPEKTFLEIFDALKFNKGTKLRHQDKFLMAKEWGGFMIEPKELLIFYHNFAKKNIF